MAPLNFTEFSEQFYEEFKDFPKDRVNRQIEKHKEKRDDYRKKADYFGKKAPEARKLAQDKASRVERKRHTMTAVKNHRTKMTDEMKAKQKFVGKDRAKTQDKIFKHGDKAGEATETKKLRKSISRHDTMYAVANSNLRNRKANNEKQAKTNREDNEARRKAKSSLTRTNLEKLYKKESLNFTEFLEAIDGVKPLYHVEGKKTGCPRGYRWSMKDKMCVPKRERDDIQNEKGNKDASPGNGAGYNTIGRTGVDGDGYAWAEPNNWGDGGSGGGLGGNA